MLALKREFDIGARSSQSTSRIASAIHVEIRSHRRRMSHVDSDYWRSWSVAEENIEQSSVRDLPTLAKLHLQRRGHQAAAIR